MPTVELALEGMTKPIGVADYKLIIPKEELQKTLLQKSNGSKKNIQSVKQRNRKVVDPAIKIQ